MLASHHVLMCTDISAKASTRCKISFDARKHVYGIFKINCFVMWWIDTSPVCDVTIQCHLYFDLPIKFKRAAGLFVCLSATVVFVFFMFLNGKEKMLGWHWNWIILLCFLTDWVVTQRFFPTNAWQPTTILSVRRFLGEISSPLVP